MGTAVTSYVLNLEQKVKASPLVVSDVLQATSFSAHN